MTRSTSYLLCCLLLLPLTAAHAQETETAASGQPTEVSRSVEEILEAYHGLQPPLPELERMEDPDYQAEYEAEFRKITLEQTRLIRELAEADLEHEALDELLELLWARTGINDLTLDGFDPIEHMQGYLARFSDRPAAKQARLYLPLSRLYRLSDLETPASQQERATAFEEIDTYLTMYPEESILNRLKLVWMKFRYVQGEEVEELAKIYTQIPLVAPDTKQARWATGQLRQINEIGQPFELAHKDLLSGESVSMEDYRGKIVAVIFWATYSAPCLTQLPRWRETLAEYEEHGVVFIGVPLNPKAERVLEFCTEKELDWPQLWLGPEAKDFTESWGIYGAPTIFVLDHEGNLASTRGKDELEAKIQELLAQRDNVGDAEAESAADGGE